MDQQSTVGKCDIKVWRRNEYIHEKGELYFGTRRLFVADEDKGGVKCVPTDNNLNESDSIGVGKHLKVTPLDVLKGEVIDYVKDQKK